MCPWWLINCVFLSFCHLYPLFSFPCLFLSVCVSHPPPSPHLSPLFIYLPTHLRTPSLTPVPLPLSTAPPLVPVAEPPLTRPLLCLLPPSRSGAWCGISWESECSVLALGFSLYPAASQTAAQMIQRSLDHFLRGYVGMLVYVQVGSVCLFVFLIVLAACCIQHLNPSVSLANYRLPVLVFVNFVSPVRGNRCSD